MKYPRKPTDFNLANYDVDKLPHSEPLEQEVLGCILAFPTNYNRILKYLNKEGMFYYPLTSAIWEQIGQMVNSGSEPTLDNVKDHYLAIGDREKAFYLSSCFAQAVSNSRLIPACLRLNEYWITRTLHRLGYFLNQNALDRKIDVLDLLGAASDGLAKIYSHIAGMQEKTLNDAADELQDELEQIAKSKTGILGLPSSLEGINNVIKGYRKGNLIVIGGTTGEGKSTLAYQEALFLLLRGIAVGIVSLEMKTSEIILIMACMLTGIKSEAVLSGTMSPNEKDAFSTARNFIKTLKLHIVDKPGMRMGEIKATLRTWKKDFWIEIGIIDHIHLANTDVQNSNAEQRFTELANQHKELAKELDIPLLALAQLARREKEGKKEIRQHQVTDLKYAGGIEQAADVVLLIYRPELHDLTTDAQGNSLIGFAKIIIGKLRLLPKFSVMCHFTGMRFVDKDEYDNGYYQEPTPENWMQIVKDSGKPKSKPSPQPTVPPNAFAGMNNRPTFVLNQQSTQPDDLPF